MKRDVPESREKKHNYLPKAQLYLAKLDLAEFDSVREFGEHLRQRYGTGSLDLLVNNAGIMALPKRACRHKERNSWKDPYGVN